MITGTVTRAAEVLSVSQPAVSRMLADLEKEIGFKLFSRANRQLIPTNEGRAFYDEVSRAFVGLDQIMECAHAIREYRSGHLRLITIPSLASTVMPELISRFAENFPKVSVSLDVQPSQRVFEWIVSQQCDVGISSLPIKNSAIVTRAFMKGEAVCVIPEKHPLARRKFIRPRDMVGQSFISFKADSIFRHMVDEVFQKAGVRRELRYEVRTTEAVYGLVAAGLGLSIIGPAFPLDSTHPRVVGRRFRPRIEVDLDLLYPADKPLSRVAERFVEIVDDYASARSGPRGKSR